MKEKIEFNIKSKYDELPIWGTIFIPENTPKGIVVLSHGMCEKRKRYFDFMEFLCGNGYIVEIHDHRGHGQSVRSEEELGYFYDTKGEAIVEDLYEVIQYMKEKYQNYPVYLFGHSMGSLVVRKFIQKYDDEIDKLIVCGSPSENSLINIALFVTQTIRILKGDKYRSKLIEYLSTGSGNKNFPDEKEKNAWLTRDKKIIKEYNEDPTMGFTFTTNGYLNLFHLVKDVYTARKYQLKNKDLPIFFIAGSDDPVIVSKEKWREAQNFLRKIGYQNLFSKLYDEMRHEILNEIGKEEVYSDILDWLNLI